MITDKTHQLILYKDTTNTITWITLSLFEICGHSKIQAEQCAHLVYYLGKIVIKTDSIKILTNMKTELENRTLTLEIKQVK